ncbi:MULTISPECIES: hypothetical protein [Rhizobium]
MGRHLIEAAQRHAVSRGIHALTLTTFRDVAWNERTILSKTRLQNAWL